MPGVATCSILTVVGAAVATVAVAQHAEPAAIPPKLTESTPCVTPASEYHGVNPWVLKAILKVESGFNAKAVNRNANGTVDVGMAQINSIHFRKLQQWGVTPADLLDGCVATYVAAWHLAGRIKEHGNTWFAIAAYHSASPCQNRRYAGLIWNQLVRWHVVQGDQVAVASLRSCGYVPPPNAATARIRTDRTVPAANAVAFDSD